MIFEEAKIQARKGIKVTHQYFSQEEYITMQGNMIVFEDGVKIFANECKLMKQNLKINV